MTHYSVTYTLTYADEKVTYTDTVYADSDSLAYQEEQRMEQRFKSEGLGYKLDSLKIKGPTP